MSVAAPSRHLAVAAALVALAGCAVSNQGSTGATTPESSVGAASGAPHVVAVTPEAAGEYVTTLGGCNDCHSPGWAESNGKLPAAQRFTGNPVGYRGPWGTTYAANLRLFVQRVTEDQWVDILRTAAHGHGQPPMPWMNTLAMSDNDLRAAYRFIHSLGPAGTRTPRNVPPGQTPTTPYVDFTPQQPGSR